MMKKTFFISFNASASKVHQTGSTVGEVVKQRLLNAEDYDRVVVTYCSDSPLKYEVKFEVTPTYVIVWNPPITVFLDKSALLSANHQNHLYNLVKAALEV